MKFGDSFLISSYLIFISSFELRSEFFNDLIESILTEFESSKLVIRIYFTVSLSKAPSALAVVDLKTNIFNEY